MPSITVTNAAVSGYNIIQLNWSDYPNVTSATVIRIEADGTESPVRAHTMVDTTGYAIELSDGLATLYDTEAPFDVPVSYRTEAEITQPTIVDTFDDRTVANGWGSTSIGAQPYTVVSGPVADFAVSGGTGGQTHPAVSSTHQIDLSSLVLTNFDLRADIFLPFNPTGSGNIQASIRGRLESSNNMLEATIFGDVGGAVETRLRYIVNGTETLTGFPFISGATAPCWITIRLLASGNSVMAKYWLRTNAEPVAWTLTQTTSKLSPGHFALSTTIGSGITNVLPATFQWDNLSINSTDIVTASATSAASVLSSGNDMWLKAPLRPWADQRMTQDTPQTPGCVPESGTYFGGMDVETRANRSAVFNVNDRKNPILSSRTRGGIQGSMVIATRRFVDRDAIVQLNASGDALMYQGPAAYGMADMYLGVTDYQVSRLSQDMKVQYRLHQLPFIEVDRPAGLMDGVLGTRWLDLCGRFATFGDAKAGGLSWSDVLLGYGSAATSPLFRIYSDIPIAFATYGAINTGGRTYEDLLEGR